jgi:hypothetical protein
MPARCETPREGRETGPGAAKGSGTYAVASGPLGGQRPSLADRRWGGSTPHPVCGSGCARSTPSALPRTRCVAPARRWRWSRARSALGAARGSNPSRQAGRPADGAQAVAQPGAGGISSCGSWVRAEPRWRGGIVSRPVSPRRRLRATSSISDFDSPEQDEAPGTPSCLRRKASSAVIRGSPRRLTAAVCRHRMPFSRLAR